MIQEILALSTVFAAALYSLRSAYHFFKPKQNKFTCAGGCTACALHAHR